MVKTYRTLQQWDHWLAQFPGTHILEIEKKLLTRIDAKQTVLVGVPRQHSLLKSNVMPHPIVISPLINKHKDIQQIESDFYQLPIIPGSVDLIILPHTLEFIDNPHRLLIEACRLVKPEGDIIILGFNPFSLWGLKRYLIKNKNTPWNGNVISASKVIKWLKLADFQLTNQEMLLFRPPLAKEKMFHNLHFLEWIGSRLLTPCGGIYALTAKAKMIPLTPIKLHWQQKLSPLSVILPGSTSMRDRQ